MQTSDKKKLSLKQYNMRSATLNSEMLKNIPEEIFINQKKKIQELKYFSEKSQTLNLDELRFDEITVHKEIPDKYVEYINT
jgi:hypothetical protein